MRVAYLLFALWLAGCSHPAPAPAPSVPNDIARAQTLAAREVVDAARAAHGTDPDARSGLRFEAHFQGTITYEGHFAQPGATVDYQVEGRVVTGTDGVGSREATLRGGNLGDDQLAERLQVARDGCTYADFGGPSEPVADAATCVTHTRSLRTTMPHGWLAEAVERADTLALLGAQQIDGESHQVVSFAGEDGQRWLLYIRDVDRLLTRAERPVAHPLWGDEAQWVRFADWRVVDGQQVPASRTERRVERDTRWVAHWSLSDWTVAADEPVRYEVVPLGPGLHQVRVTDADTRVLVAELDEGLAVFGAPLGTDIGERLLDSLGAAFPDRPVKWLIVGHHHAHYAGGLRPFVHAGVTIVAAAENEAYLRARLAQAHRLAPDRLQRDPHEPDLLLVDGERVLGDGERVVRLLDIGPRTNHTDTYLIAHLPHAKVLYEDDLGHFPAEERTRGPSGRERALHAAVTARGLEVDWIVQGWPLEGTRDWNPWAPFDALLRETPP